jgi:hypothetical protein
VTLEKSHGKTYPAVAKPAKLPDGAQASEQAEASEERRPNGTFAKGARTVQQQGGRALKNRTALSHAGLSNLATLPAFAPYLAKAKAFHRAHCGELARTVGAGECGPAPSVIALSAALQQAASRYWFDQAAATGDPAAFQLASRLADASRQNMIAAHELCAREGEVLATARSHEEFMESLYK